MHLGDFNLKKLALGSGVLLVTVVSITLILSYTVPLPERFNQRDSVVVEWENQTAAHVFLSEDDRWRIPVELHRVDPDYVEALIQLEDSRYWWHPGVDPLAIIRAAGSNLMEGRVVSGASTITMQLVRLMEPRPRTLTSKVIEAFRALQLEIRFTKEEILERYLTLVPYGKNFEGLSSASYTYFGRSPKNLSPNQVATLLSVPQDPTNRHPNPTHEKTLRHARESVARDLMAGETPEAFSEWNTGAELAAYLADKPVPTEFEEIPQSVPHVAWWLTTNHPDKMRFETNLKSGIQRTASQILKQHHSRLEQKDIHNLATLIVDNNTGAVRAAIGNVDFWDFEHGGQIPGFDVHRSTGSLLKPFIYAFAIDRGIAAPSHLVPDIPKSYHEYTPENFQGTYHGLIRLEEALSKSLNIPFVSLLKELEVDTLLGMFTRMGIEAFQYPVSDYGLSVAVGGMELTPLQVATLYTAFANGGDSVQPQILKRESQLEKRDKSNPPISPASAWLTRRALSKRDRPDFPSRASITGVPNDIHWKTGTSARNRDGWSVGSGGKYTAVVWAGNFDNSRSPELVGAPIAGPILFEILESLELNSSAELDPRPDTLVEQEVCAFSGHLPKPECPRTRKALFPKHSVSTKRCPYHVERIIDQETGKAVTTACQKSAGSYKRKTFLELPSNVRQWFDRGTDTLAPPPPFAEDCEEISASERSAPDIQSPKPNASFVLMPGLAASEQEIPLEATTETGHAKLHWFIDGKLIATKRASEKVWWKPTVGQHTLVVMDAYGQSDKQKLTVQRR